MFTYLLEKHEADFRFVRDEILSDVLLGIFRPHLVSSYRTELIDSASQNLLSDIWYPVNGFKRRKGKCIRSLMNKCDGIYLEWNWNNIKSETTVFARI